MLVNEKARQHSLLAQQGGECGQQLTVGEPSAPYTDDLLHRLEDRLIYDRRERSVGADPHLWRIGDALGLELERCSVVHVVANVLFICQNLANGTARKGSPQVREASARRNLAFALQEQVRSALVPLSHLTLPGSCGRSTGQREFLQVVLVVGLDVDLQGRQ